jgi:D-arginine dehydrogenase
MMETEILIVGAGIAGAGLAYRLAGAADVLLLDMEAQAGYHTTGRSAAFYAETYGGPKIQPLTTASKDFFRAPPEGFTDVPLLTRLGALHVFRQAQRAAAEAAFAGMAPALPGVRLLSREEVLSRAPHLEKGGFAGGIDDPDCGNLDVAALHQGYLRAAKKAGARVLLEAGLEAAAHDGSRWHVRTRTGQIKARVLVNCAGAWADSVAERAGVSPLGFRPLRRTIITVPCPGGLPFDAHGPVVMDIGEAFYFKPEGRGYLVSPADETPSAPCDAQPDMEDVAVAADHFERATGAGVSRIDAKWAGLRTFAPDKAPVIGYDTRHPAFFWNAGQGGYGIQTSPAWSHLAASLLQGEALPAALAAHRVDPALYAPGRLDAR